MANFPKLTLYEKLYVRSMPKTPASQHIPGREHTLLWAVYSAPTKSAPPQRDTWTRLDLTISNILKQYKISKNSSARHLTRV